MKVLVTGASGFLGAAVCAGLRERGHTVSALARRPGSAPDGVEELKGDLTDGEGLRTAAGGRPPGGGRAPRGGDRLAARRGEIREVNVRRDRAADRGVRRPADDSPRFVFASTVVTGEADGELLDRGERAARRDRLRALQAGGRAPAAGVRPAVGVILRPWHVYGPGGWYEEEFVRRLRQPGRFAVIGSGENWWDVVHVDDVAGALRRRRRARAGRRALPRRRRRTDHALRLRRADRRGTGRRPPAAGPGGARAARGRAPRRHRGRALGAHLNARIKRELGWSPRYPSAREGVPAAVSRLPSA